MAKNIITGKVVCWVCKRGNKTLHKVGDYDYVCVDHINYRIPKVPNQSINKLNIKRKIKNKYAMPNLP